MRFSIGCLLMLSACGSQPISDESADVVSDVAGDVSRDVAVDVARDSNESDAPGDEGGSDVPSSDTPSDDGIPSGVADVVGVSAGSGRLAVTIHSPDLGCEQYADWWEVITPEGSLVARRILAHSHVDEQPFTRSGAVEIAPSQVVVVRAHMHPGGYGGRAMRGSIDDGFADVSGFGADVASELAETAPLPDGCAF